MNKLNWIPLKERRTISRLTLFHKAIHGDGGLAFPDYVTKRRRHLRNSSQNKFIELLPNTETYKNSYFCRTVKDWNVLPSDIVNIKSADRFKKVLFEYFSPWWILILHNEWCCEINYFNYYYYFFMHFTFYRFFFTSLLLILSTLFRRLAWWLPRCRTINFWIKVKLTWKHTLREHKLRNWSLCLENNMDNRKTILRNYSVACEVRVNLNYSTEVHFTLVYLFKNRTWQSKPNMAANRERASALGRKSGYFQRWFKYSKAFEVLNAGGKLNIVFWSCERKCWTTL